LQPVPEFERLELQCMKCSRSALEVHEHCSALLSFWAVCICA